jgi:hypothetical protein
VRRLTLVVVAACGGSAPAPTSPTEAPPAEIDCATLRETGRAQLDARRATAAVATFRSGLPRCAAQGFHHELGRALVIAGERDAAAAEFVAELRTDGERPPPAEMFEQLSTIFERLGSARRNEITRLGRSKDTAIRVPDASVMYAWLDRFGCSDNDSHAGIGTRAIRRGQTVVEHRGRRLDALLVACAGAEQMIYFAR